MSNRNAVKHHNVLGSKAENGTLYASLPMTLARDRRLTHTARSVAMYIWSHDEKWQQSAKAIAEALDTTRETVASALAVLQDHGWLVRETYTKPGNVKPSYEVWHLQMSNVPFTPEEVLALSGNPTPQGDGKADTATPGVTGNPSPGCRENRHEGCRETQHHRSGTRSAPEVHDWSSARTDLVETGLSRSLLVAEEIGEDDQQESDSFWDSTPDLATAKATDWVMSGGQRLTVRAAEDPWGTPTF